MKILTDDPDWARDLYETRAAAMMLIAQCGRPCPEGAACRIVERGGLTVTHDASQSPVLLTIDSTDRLADTPVRVLSVEWHNGDAWRVAIETYHRGPWQSRLRTMVYPRPWLEYWRAIALFSARPSPKHDVVPRSRRRVPHVRST
jgi:hypothetical protein